MNDRTASSVRRKLANMWPAAGLAAGAAAAGAADDYRKLKGAEIKARLAGMETTDEVHWAEEYMRDGSFKMFSMGKVRKGKWSVRNGDLCLEGRGVREQKAFSRQGEPQTNGGRHG